MSILPGSRGLQNTREAPGFQFIQDPLDYETRTHHYNMDVYERVVEEDMKQAACIMAFFVYNAATREEKFPRKPVMPPGR